MQDLIHHWQQCSALLNPASPFATEAGLTLHPQQLKMKEDSDNWKICNSGVNILERGGENRKGEQEYVT